jgi:hypothetical protein
MTPMHQFGKRHYEVVARVLYSSRPISAGDESQWERTCLAFTNHFKTDNPKFDSERFLAACKGE